ncbi:unnamed protein product [Camellia sinensis]
MVWDVSCGKNVGRHKLRLWPSKEADGSIQTTTPGKVPKEECGELERLEKLVNKYETGQIQRVDWMDRLVFKAMDKIKERESGRMEVVYTSWLSPAVLNIKLFFTSQVQISLYHLL